MSRPREEWITVKNGIIFYDTPSTRWGRPVKLFKAAPDLLEAAKALIASQQWQDREMEPEEVALAQAIRKAEGRS